MNLAKVYADNDFVPGHFKGKPNNVFIALEIAHRCGLSPFGVLQNIYIVPGTGKPAFESKLAIAMLNASGKVTGPPSYVHEGKGKERSCTASVCDMATGRVLSHKLHWATVEAEGWPARKGSKWVTDPLLMLEYRAAMRLMRTHYPDVLLGIYSVDEVAEMNDPTRISSVELWDTHSHGGERIEEATSRADAQAGNVEAAQTESADEPFTGIGDEHFVARLEAVENLGQVTALEDWAISQADDGDEQEWVRDMCRRRAEAIREGRSETQAEAKA